MKDAIFHPLAETELREAGDYYEERVPGLGADFETEVKLGLNRVVANPQLWRRITARHRRYLIKRFPYKLVYEEMADVIRRAGIYGPRDYLKIVEEQIRFWSIETLDGLDEMGKRAQEKILAVPKRLERVADMMETRSRAKTFSFAVAFAHEFAMD